MIHVPGADRVCGCFVGVFRPEDKSAIMISEQLKLPALGIHCDGQLLNTDQEGYIGSYSSLLNRWLLMNSVGGQPLSTVEY